MGRSRCYDRKERPKKEPKPSAGPGEQRGAGARAQTVLLCVRTAAVSGQDQRLSTWRIPKGKRTSLAPAKNQEPN